MHERKLTRGLASLLGCWLFLGPQARAQDGIPGEPGVATHHDVANFSELATQEALHPLSTQPRHSKPVFRVPKRLHHLPVPQNVLAARSSATPIAAPKT